jgi:hypothetical protein
MKNTYTRKQRKEIYLKAAATVFEADLKSSLSEGRIPPEAYNRYACHAMARATGLNWRMVDNHLLFPELIAFKNHYYASHEWLSGSKFDGPATKDGNEFRQLVLLFAAELCNDTDFK